MTIGPSAEIRCMTTCVRLMTGFMPKVSFDQ